MLSRNGPVSLLSGLSFSLLRQRKGMLYWLAIGSALLHLLLWIPGELEWLSIPVWNFALAIGQLPYVVVVLTLLALGARKNNYYAALLPVPMSLSYLSFLLQNGFWVYESAAHPDFRELRVAWFYQLSEWPFPFFCPRHHRRSGAALGVRYIGAAICADAPVQTALGLELEAARAVQNVIVIPAQIPVVPGFDITAFYSGRPERWRATSSRFFCCPTAVRWW